MKVGQLYKHKHTKNLVVQISKETKYFYTIKAIKTPTVKHWESMKLRKDVLHKLLEETYELLNNE